MELNKADYRIAASGTDQGTDQFFNKQYDFARQTIVPFVAKYLGELKPSSFLDVGCGCGGTAAAFKEAYEGIKLYGVEPVLGHGEYAKEKVGMDVYAGLFEDFETDKRFDVIVYTQTINHTLDPRGNLEKIRELLTNEGVLFIGLWDLVNALLNRPLERMAEVYHPYVFCSETIKFLVEKTGFEIVGYEERLLDGGNLTRKDIPGLSFPKIRLAAKRVDFLREDIKKPDYKEILGRLERNVSFYKEWGKEIDKWYKPNFMRKLYRYVVHGL
jgi:SAM-dependent methyltransferase